MPKTIESRHKKPLLEVKVSINKTIKKKEHEDHGKTSDNRHKRRMARRNLVYNVQEDTIKKQFIFYLSTKDEQYSHKFEEFSKTAKVSFFTKKRLEIFFAEPMYNNFFHSYFFNL